MLCSTAAPAERPVSSVGAPRLERVLLRCFERGFVPSSTIQSENGRLGYTVSGPGVGRRGGGGRRLTTLSAAWHDFCFPLRDSRTLCIIWERICITGVSHRIERSGTPLSHWTRQCISIGEYQETCGRE